MKLNTKPLEFNCRLADGNTKPLKFKCRLADGGGAPGGGGLADPCNCLVQFVEQVLAGVAEYFFKN